MTLTSSSGAAGAALAAWVAIVGEDFLHRWIRAGRRRSKDEAEETNGNDLLLFA